MTGCGSGGDAERRFDGLTTLVVGEEPDVRIGVTKGAAPYLLRGVADATRQSDGTIVVADCSASELRYFDSAGRFLRMTGGPGQGPSEFNLLRRIFPLGADTIGVDHGLKVAIVAPDGAVVQTILAAGEVLGRMSDGTFLEKRWTTHSLVQDGDRVRITVKLVRFDGTGQPRDSLVDLPASDAIRPAQSAATPTTALRLRRRAVFAVHPRGVFYSGQDEAGIVGFDTTLAQTDVFVPLTRPEPVTRAVQAAYDEMVDNGDHRPPDDMSAGAPPPAAYAPMMPAHGELIAGRDGQLWVQDPVRPGSYPLAWTAYEGAVPVARAEIPARFFPFEFGRDWVLGVSYDSLTVERVELWRLVPGPLSDRVYTPREAAPPTLPSLCGAWTSR